MILKTLLQRLYAGLADGPGLNARPHQSRQRLDPAELRHLGGADPAHLAALLLDPSRGSAHFSARITSFTPPERPEHEWTEAQRSTRQSVDRQTRLLDKLRDIAADAGEYFNDHGESALFVGFPLLSLPPVADRTGLPSRRVLAPVAFIPVQLRVRRGPVNGVTLEAAGDGVDRLIPNPALLAWLEQQTGKSTEDLFADDAGEEPWRELATLIELVARAARIAPVPVFDADTLLQPVPRTDDLPESPTLLPGAVLGLFPTANPGLLRDTAWMRDHEPELGTPVSGFLRPEALLEPERDPTDQTDPSDQSDRSEPPRGQRSFVAEFPVAPADPCQAQAVAHARLAPALVIHGPPGTGKSQTISNIIGDHLARGERVLFVCDKRTALDVVHYRLTALGLGGLCGVIHDAQGDRRDFYLHLRSILEALTETPALADPSVEVDRLNTRLTALHAELSSAFRQLHGPIGTRSFHELCGEWIALRDGSVPDLPDIEGFTPDRLAGLEADCEEVVSRAHRAGWPTHPGRDRLALTPEAWLARDRDGWDAFFRSGVELATAFDALPHPTGSPLSPSLGWTAQAAVRHEIVHWLERIDRRGDPILAQRFADGSDPGRWIQISSELRPAAALETTVDRDLWPQVRDSVPGLAELRRQKLALEQWAEVAGSWKRFLAFGRRKAAKPVFDRLALPMDPDSTARAQQFIEALLHRWQWSELRSEIVGQPSATLIPDVQLIALRDGLPEFEGLHRCLATDAAAPLRDAVLRALKEPGLRAGLIQALRDSAARAEALVPMERHWLDSGFLTRIAWIDWVTTLGTGEPALPLAAAFAESAPSLEDAVRLTDRLRSLPAPVIAAVREVTARGLPWDLARPALRAGALAHEMRRRLRSSPELARIDSARVDAALGELGRLGDDKARRVRELILHRWQKRWRERLLAGTGTRLNSLGASLRQRLFVRGQRALKLRQMIATGAGTEGGDPLFDLCPVWMASPATVAQVFPRETLFDVVIFDEASQCRLEEALPVLLRARRVVIAGDPRQLPPTRFFEASNVESDDTAAETAVDVFDRQQAEAEDLLSAALNLAVQESFLDVHYRSRDAALIGFSNQAFYGGRLVPLPGHPQRVAVQSALRLHHVGGIYADRGNEAEAVAAVEIVAGLLALPEPPSIGIACFNLPQRDLILDSLEARAAEDPEFATRLASARERRGPGSFEGLFVKNLENVQGDERDHLILCTTFGPDAEGRFRRNFGALSRTGGERRLNVLVTRAREVVHILTSIPRTEYAVAPAADPAARLTGRHFLYGYLRYAEACARIPVADLASSKTEAPAPVPTCTVRPSRNPSPVATALGKVVHDRSQAGTTVHWGNDGFCVDVAIDAGSRPGATALGVLTDFNRYGRSPDPIAWEQFRTQTLEGLGWELHRVWSPGVFRDLDATLKPILRPR